MYSWLHKTASSLLGVASFCLQHLRLQFNVILMFFRLEYYQWKSFNAYLQSVSDHNNLLHSYQNPAAGLNHLLQHSCRFKLYPTMQLQFQSKPTTQLQFHVKTTTQLQSQIKTHNAAAALNQSPPHSCSLKSKPITQLQS